MAGFVESRNGRYRARFTPPGGREISETFDRKGDANDWLDRQRGDAVRGTWMDPRGGKTLFGDVAKRFMDGQVHLREPTLVKRERNLKLHILPAFGSRQLRSITHASVQSWVKSLSGKGLAAGTVEGVFRLLAQILAYAVADERLIAESPCSKRVNLPVIASKLTIPTLEQIELVHDRLPARWRRASARGNGLRQGELFGLTVDRVDFLRRQVTVDRQLQRRARLQRFLDEGGRLPKGSGIVALGGGLFLVEVKVARSNRVVPLGRWALELFAEQIAEFPPGDHGLIFTTSTGRPVTVSTLENAWERATRKRLAPDPEIADPGEHRGARDPALAPHFTIHDERHFYASGLIAKGLSPVAVAKILGDTEETVLKTYAHLWPDDFDRARAAADEFLAGEVEQVTAWARPGHGQGS